jgi:hypothetical protein
MSMATFINKNEIAKKPEGSLFVNTLRGFSVRNYSPSRKQECIDLFELVLEALTLCSPSADHCNRGQCGSSVKITSQARIDLMRNDGHESKG